MVWTAHRFVAGLQIHFRAGKVGMLVHLDTPWGEKLHFQLVKKKDNKCNVRPGTQRKGSEQ